jgi:predicted RNA-binding Zn ribbon-like protein
MSVTASTASTASTPAPGRLETVRRFVNTVDVEAGTDAIESAAELRRWLVGADLLGPATRVVRADVTAARALREALRAAAAANHDGARLPDDVVLTLNQAAERARLAVSITADRRWRPRPRAGGVTGALGTIVALVVDAMTDGSWPRLKVCVNDTCRWAFFDASRAGTGRWCSMRICGNRAKQEAWRARRRLSG